jgi:hypothetical protein
VIPSPKEKAEELFIKFYPNWYDNGLVAKKKYAKEYAIIAVEEIINSSPTNPLKGGYIELYSDMVDEAIEYYKEVKKEIELL